MKYNLHTLDNGMRIVLAPMRDISTATVIIMTGTGSRYENKEENGLAHFLEHMIFKGSKKYKNGKVISETLDGIGGMYNAFTAKDRTAYYAKVPKRHITTAVDVISDIFLTSKLPQKEIDKERGAILQEINMYEDMPMHSIDDIFDATHFATGTALSRTILGPKKNILNFTKKDFNAYITRNYVADNTVICIAGNFAEASILRLLKKTFKDMRIGALPACEPAALRTMGTPKITIKHKKTEQTQLMLGFTAYPTGHKDEYVQLLLNTVLGVGMSSRLFTEVREKRGLAYSVRSWVDTFSDTGYLAVQAGIEHKNLLESTEIIIKTFKKLQRTKVSDAELHKAREFILGHKAIQSEQTDALATSIATQLLSRGKVTPHAEVTRKLKKVTSDDVQRVAKDIFKKENMTLAIIGPHKESTELAEVLNKA